MNYITKRNENLDIDAKDKLVIAMFYYESSSWGAASFCGNVLELVEKYKILDQAEEFIRWSGNDYDPKIEFYVEKNIISELEKEKENNLLIDAAVGDLMNGSKMGMLFLRKKAEVYG